MPLEKMPSHSSANTSIFFRTARGKENKAMEREVISTYQSAQSLGC